MEKFLKEYKALLIVAILTLGILVFVYYKGKKSGAVNIPDAPYIHGSEGIPTGFNPNVLADILHSAMSGLFTLSGNKDKAWRQLLELSTDDMVIAVYNAFNSKYGKEGKGSLTQWINDEYYYDFTSGIKTKVLTRLRNLRLT
ncbi:hypothetical protein Pedsa_0874 [Pseudopedobacter saltans DSM 12145]|uniref:Uncharacterized protein n=1 Tax=Pseudopedobacter saltans (strain ATCC 51119 / DSM 12145 / JCM 21818 / CCUG 39354 / LMG 10337 / NBRC 100064 / NCIMB 13643) TaxID=762903 RepID=F0S9U0_PSESL|nr:hypothetical protein [Pseudopedobacter saltans]ADY51446.1 hypothetical protein Pedsa_0874 [Pseudopedobacter saltans DSM 12145]